MTTDDSEDWPPPGWRIEDKVNKGRRTMCYINVKTGLKLYSKHSVIRHLNKANVNSESPQLVNKESKRGSGKKQIQPVAEDNSPDWLPEGWTIELQTVRSGRKEGRQCKCYVDPSTGSRFYSKLEVSRHLESTNGGASASNLEREHDTSRKLNNCSPVRIQSETSLNVSKSGETCEANWCISGKKKVKIEKTIDKELPAGWIKEIRVKKFENKVRKDTRPSSAKQGRATRSSARKLQFVGKENPEGSALSLPKPGGLKISCSREPSGIVTPPQIGEDGYSAEEMTGSDSPIDENIDLDRLIFTITRGVNLDDQARSLMESFPAAISNEPSAVASCLAGPSHNFTQENEKKGTKTERVNPNAGESQAAADLKDGAPASPASENVVQEKIPGDSRGGRDEETPPGIVTDNCVGSKGQSSKHNTKMRKGLILPSRSSKRLTKTERVNPNAGESQAAADLKDGAPASPASENVVQEKIPGDSRGGRDEETPPGIVTDNCVGSKGQSSKHNTKKRKGLILPYRSSKRLAGVEVEPVSNTIPIERALRARNRKSCSKTESTSPLVLNSDELHLEKAQQVDESLETRPAPPVCGQADAPEVEDSSSDKKNPAEVSASLEQKNPAEVFAALKHKSSNLVDSPNDNKNSAELSAALKQKSSSLVDSSNDNKNPAEVSAVLKQKSSNLEVYPNDKNLAEVSAALKQKSSNLEDSQNDNKNTADVPAALRQIISNLEDSPKDNNNLVEVPATLDQKSFNLEDSANDNKNPAEVSAALEQKSSHLQINGGESVPPESQFCIPSFWSDPCLEFAFKTLTGAMPVAVDDNLESIKEYLQHQRRTSAANDNAAATNSNNLIPDTSVDSNLNIDASAAFASLENADSLQQSQMQHVTSYPVDIGRNSLSSSNLVRK